MQLANPLCQWAMVIPIGIVFALLPETPWWLASKGKLDKAAKVLRFCNGGVPGYDVQEQIVSSCSRPMLSRRPVLPPDTCADSMNRMSW